MKYLIINMIKDVKDPHTENYKTVLIEIKDINNGKIYYAYGSKDLLLLKCQFFPNWSIDCTHPPGKVSACLLKNF